MTFNNKFRGVDYEKVVRDLLSRKTTVQQLCLDLGLSKKSLIGHLYRRGFNYDEYQWTTLGPVKKDDASAWEFLKRHYDDGKTITELAEIIGFTEPVVDRIFNRWGWVKRPVSEVFSVCFKKRTERYRKKYGVGHHPVGRKRAVETTRLKLCRQNAPEISNWLNSAGFKLMEQYRGRQLNNGTHPRYKIRHQECGTMFEGTLRFEPRCPLCRPSKKLSSKEEAQYTRFLRSQNLDVITGSRRVVRSSFGRQWYELDMYCPEKKLGFEHNGLFYHSVKSNPKTLFASQKDPHYHAKKSVSALCSGVGVVHIWSHDNKDIAHAMIQKLIGATKEVDLRITETVELPESEAARFFDKNHIRGHHTESQRCFGIRADGLIIAAMSLRKNGIDAEILRYSTEGNILVSGGVTRLVERAVESMGSKRFVAYRNRDWCPIPDQSDLAKAGFVLDGDMGPTEYWTDWKRVWRSKPPGEVKYLSPFYTSGNWKFTLEV